MEGHMGQSPFHVASALEAGQQGAILVAAQASLTYQGLVTYPQSLHHPRLGMGRREVPVLRLPVLAVYSPRSHAVSPLCAPAFASLPQP